MPSLQLHENKFITEDSKVCAVGSCFADEMGWCLRNHGVNIGDHGVVVELKHVLYQWGTFFNPMNMADCLDRLINDSWHVEDRHFAYIPNEETIYYLFMKVRANSSDLNVVKKRLKEVEAFWRDWLAQSDVVIFTLGLVETWIDKENGRAWQNFVGKVMPPKSYEDRACFKVLKYEDCLKYVKQCIDLVSNFGQKKQIVLTVSPVPLEFTFRDVDVIVANRYSKSVLRTVADTITEEYDRVHYFPSFEIVSDCVGWPNAYKEEDLRHIKVDVFAEQIAPLFLKHFSDFNTD